MGRAMLRGASKKIREQRRNTLYDNTSVRAQRVLRAGLMGGLTSPARPWFRLGTTDPQLQQRADVKEWLSTCTRIMMDIFDRSNTYRSFHVTYGDTGVFGTSAEVFVPNYDRVVHTYHMPVGEYCLAQDWEGNVNTMYREFDRSVDDVVGEFGLANVSKRVKDLYDSGDYSAPVALAHLIEPRRERDPRMRDAINMKFKSCYYEAGDSGSLLRESGFPEFPVLAQRWDAEPGEVYASQCPGMEGLGDVQQLQQEQLRKSQGIDYQTMPPLQVPIHLKDHDVDTLPGGRTYYDAVTGAAPIKTLFDVQLDMQHLLADIGDVRQRIERAFYTDLFLLIASTSDTTQRTAAEIAARDQEKMLLLGPVLESFHDELLDPKVSRTFEIMLQANLVPPPPESMHGKEINITLISVLAQAQRAVATNGVDRFTSTLGVIAAQINPDVRDKFDVDAWADRYSDMLGVDPEFIVPGKEVTLIRQARQQAQQQAQQAALADAHASAANKLAGAPTQGGSSTALDDIVNQFSGYGG
jgi:hypothetical protein